MSYLPFPFCYVVIKFRASNFFNDQQKLLWSSKNIVKVILYTFVSYIIVLSKCLLISQQISFPKVITNNLKKLHTWKRIWNYHTNWYFGLSQQEFGWTSWRFLVDCWSIILIGPDAAVFLAARFKIRTDSLRVSNHFLTFYFINEH